MSATAEGMGGYVAVDAMVAMLIISMSAILSLRALDQADHVARRAEEIRQARILLNELVDEGARDTDVAQGRTGAFNWTIETQATGADRPVAVCRRVANLTAIGATRRYTLSTFEPCPTVAGG